MGQAVLQVGLAVQFPLKVGVKVLYFQWLHGSWGLGGVHGPPNRRPLEVVGALQHHADLFQDFEVHVDNVFLE